MERPFLSALCYSLCVLIICHVATPLFLFFFYGQHPYKFETDVPRLNLIVQNCGARVALTDSQYMMVIRSVAVKNVFSRVGLANAVTWPSLRNVQTDKVRKSYAHTDLLIEPHNTSQDLCFLQYTSGSTSAPKGVMVTHGNIIAQVKMALILIVAVVPGLYCVYISLSLSLYI